MLVQNQIVDVVWSNRTKQHYIGKGYQYTKRYDHFACRAEDLSPGSTAIVKVLCDDCGCEFEKEFQYYHRSKLENRPDRCGSCAVKYAHSHTYCERRDSKFDQLEQICNELGYELLTDRSEYTGLHMDIRFRCPLHGVKTMSLCNILHGHECIDCSYEKRGINCRHTFDEVEAIINQINGNILLNKEEYTGANTHNLRILCGKCGKHEFTTSLSDYYNRGKTQCRSCSKAESAGERLIAEYLREHDIRFKREHRYKDCVDKSTLPFDFYLLDRGSIIEFDGQHHFSPDVWGPEHYESTVRHDNIKNEYCLAHNIPLLRIPYWEGHRIPEIIGMALKENKI